MSSMLEQAIIDATALKEAAVKNAEAESGWCAISGISPLTIDDDSVVNSVPKSIMNLELYVFAWIIPFNLEPEATFVSSSIWSMPVFCFGYLSYNVVSRSA